MIRIPETLFWIIAIILAFTIEYLINKEEMPDGVSAGILWYLFGWWTYYLRGDRGFAGVWLFIKIAVYIIAFRWLTVTVKLPFIAKPLFVFK